VSVIKRAIEENDLCLDYRFSAIVSRTIDFKIGTLIVLLDYMCFTLAMEIVGLCILVSNKYFIMSAEKLEPPMI